MKKWLGRLVKIGFFLFAFFAVIATLLYNMGGSSQTLKSAIEDYIGQSTGYAAQIETFNNMTFFPNIGVDIENLRLKSVDVKAMEAWAKAEGEKPLAEQGRTPPPIGFRNPDATIEKLILSIGFFDAGLGQGRKFHKLSIKNAEFNAGVLSDKPVNFEAVEIDETADGKPFLNIEGAIGNEEFSAAVDLEKAGRKSNRKYKIGEESKFVAAISDITANGVIRPRTMGGLHFRDAEIAQNEKDIVKATLSLIRNPDAGIELNGDFEMIEFGSTGEFDLNINPSNAAPPSGELKAETIDMRDFDENSALSSVWKTLKTLGGMKNDNVTQPLKTDIMVKTKTLKNATKTIAPYNGHIILNNQSIAFESSPESIKE